jgi:hypothetical protein
MRGIKHSIIVLVTLFTIAGMMVASLAQARSNWRKSTTSQLEMGSPLVCIDKLYRITHCQAMHNPLIEKQMLWQSLMDGANTTPNYFVFALNKSRCRHKQRQRPNLLQTLFPGIQDLRLELDSFALNVEMPTEINNIGQSIVHLGYRNCW